MIRLPVKPGGPGIGAVDGRMRAGEHDAALIDQRLKVLEMPRPDARAERDAVRHVARDDRVQHQLPLPSRSDFGPSRAKRSKTLARPPSTRERPIIPQVLKYTQVCYVEVVHDVEVERADARRN